MVEVYILVNIGIAVVSIAFGFLISVFIKRNKRMVNTKRRKRDDGTRRVVIKKRNPTSLVTDADNSVTVAQLEQQKADIQE